MPPRGCNSVLEPVNIDDMIDAIYENDTTKIELIDKCLLTKDAARTNDTLLHIASRTGRIEFVNALIKAGANVNEVDMFGVTPLIAAVEAYVEGGVKMNIIHALLDAGADVRHAAPGKGRTTAIKLADAAGDTELAALLRKHLPKSGGRRTRNRRTRRTRRGTR